MLKYRLPTCVIMDWTFSYWIILTIIRGCWNRMMLPADSFYHCFVLAFRLNVYFQPFIEWRGFGAAVDRHGFIKSRHIALHRSFHWLIGCHYEIKEYVVVIITWNGKHWQKDHIGTKLYAILVANDGAHPLVHWYVIVVRYSIIILTSKFARNGKAFILNGDFKFHFDWNWKGLLSDCCPMKWYDKYFIHFVLYHCFFSI